LHEFPQINSRNNLWEYELSRMNIRHLIVRPT